PGQAPMNDDYPAVDAPREDHTLGSSTLYNLLNAFIEMRERNDRQHKMLEQKFNQFAGETHKAYQNLRQETQGEKRFSLALLNELLDIHMEMVHIVAQRPALEDTAAMKSWADAVEVQSRKVKDAVQRFGIQEYDAVISSAYNPALHERVGSARVEGMGPNLVAE